MLSVVGFGLTVYGNWDPVLRSNLINNLFSLPLVREAQKGLDSLGGHYIEKNLRSG